MPTRTTSAKWVTGAVLTGVVVRLWFGLGYWHHKPLTHDEQDTWCSPSTSRRPAASRASSPAHSRAPRSRRSARAPLYPAVLAALFTVTGQPTDRLPDSVPRAVQIAQACLAALTIWSIAALARRAMDPTSGAVAAWIAALYPPLVWSSAYALSEAVYTPLVLGSALLAGSVTDRRHMAPNRATTGRSPSQAPWPGSPRSCARPRSSTWSSLVGWLAWRRRWGLALALGLSAAVVVAPWTLRNLIVHGRPIVVAADGGVNFWMGNHPLAIGEGDMAANPAIKAAHVEFRARLAHLSPEQREPYYYRAALTYLADHPADAARLVVKKLFYTFVPIGPSYTLHSPLYYWATVLSYGALFLLTLPGLPAMRRHAHPPRALGLLVLSSVLVCLVFFPQDRYRIPVMDPALCVGASWLLARVIRRTWPATP